MHKLPEPLQEFDLNLFSTILSLTNMFHYLDDRRIQTGATSCMMKRQMSSIS